MDRFLLILLLSVTVATKGFALFSSDFASDYGSSWNTGDNNGSGFNAWDLDNSNNNSNTVYAGAFIGDSSSGAADVNTGTNQSFGLFANPVGAYISAVRGFSSNLSVNDQFNVKLAVNFDNGNKGFNLRNGVTNVFGFNVSNGASINSDFTNNAIVAQYDYGGDALIDAGVQIISTDSLSYEISRTSNVGIQGILYSGTITDINLGIDNVEFYVSGTDNGSAENNLYFNSLQVTEVPEPAHISFILLSSLIVLTLLRRRLA
jgi:hypothetical protein